MRGPGALRASMGVLGVLRWLSPLLNLFAPRFDRAANLARRAAAALPPGPLNGQGLPPLAALPYGCRSMAYNGCEVVAAYNALLFLDRPTPFWEVAAALEQRGLLLNGLGGTHPGALRSYLRRCGLKVETLGRRAWKSGYDAALDGAPGAILLYWTGAPLKRPDGSWNTLHTVFVRPTAHGVALYNVWSDCPHPTPAPSLGHFLAAGDYLPVCLLRLTNPETNDILS